MRRVNILSLIALSFLPLTSCNENISSSSSSERIDERIINEYTVRFLANIPTVNVTLSSGYNALGDDILYESVKVVENFTVNAPSTNPTRLEYDFVCWCYDKDGNYEYDFTEEVTCNLNLYAKWQRSASSDDEAYVEPKLTFEEKTDSSVDTIKIDGVLNSKINNNMVELTTIGIRKLNENSTDVKELLNYTINPSKKIASATYDNNMITVTLESNEQYNIVVNNVTSTLKIANSTYETKAVNYENKSDIKPYNVVLAGSSSMENWSTSTSDMDPITTVNVGIGGTTANQWSDSLAYRLIYPFSPREVVLYVGINNIINAGNTGDETGEALITLFDNIHEHLPDTTIFFVLMNLVPDYMKYESAIKRANSMALSYGEDKDYMRYIDAGSLLMKESGTPNRAYFLSDGLHMSLYGYIIWGGKVKESVINFEKEKYNGRA